MYFIAVICNKKRTFEQFRFEMNPGYPMKNRDGRFVKRDFEYLFVSDESRCGGYRFDGMLELYDAKENNRYYEIIQSIKPAIS